MPTRFDVDLAIVKINEERLKEGEEGKRIHLLDAIEEVLPIELKFIKDINLKGNLKSCIKDINILKTLVTWKRPFYNKNGGEFKKIHKGCFIFINDRTLEDKTIKGLVKEKNRIKGNVFILGFDSPEEEDGFKLKKVRLFN